VSYEVFARFYDALQGDRAEHAAYVRGLIEKHRPRAETVLEFACGTGSILKQLQPHYRVTGLDRSKEMLAVAAEKVPGVRLIQGDMTSTQLGETFDVALCVYDSINHLLKFSQWEAVFDRACEHLADGGIFIFDINTERRLAELAEQPPLVDWFGDRNLIVLDVRGGTRGTSLWSVEIFERVGGDNYRFHGEEIPEISFPTERIKAALSKRFTRVRVYDAQRSRPTARSGRLHFVATAAGLTRPSRPSRP
jgi:SAM-dependent methyltransferase